MKIKLCGVRTVADALLCANEGADVPNSTHGDSSSSAAGIGRARSRSSSMSDATRQPPALSPPTTTRLG